MIIDNLKITTHTGRVIIHALSFAIGKNDKIAIIGEEGNGKSTLLKALYNKKLIEDYVKVEGVVQTLNQKIGYLPQLLPNEWKQKTVVEFLLQEEVDTDIEPSAYNEFYRIEQYFSKLHINKQLLDDEPTMNQISGGERIKIQLVKILMMNPDVLLLDEPTNDLDMDTLIWLEDFLLEVDLPILFISHDEVLLETVANRILHLEQLKRKTEPVFHLVSCGYRDYIQTRQDLIFRQTKIAKKERAEHSSQMERWRQIYEKVNHRQATISRQDPHGGQLLKKKMKNVLAVKRRLDQTDFTDIPDPEESITIFFDAKKSIPSNRIILDFHLDELKIENRLLSHNVHLFIKGNEKVVIIGKNGTGKTTLLKKIKEKLELDEKVKIGYVSQNYDEQMDERFTPITYVDDTKEKDKITRIRTLLGALKFTSDEMEQSVQNLSGGQKAKLMLLKLIVDENDILLLDEPSRNLSPLSNPVVREMFSQYHGAILAITHDRKFMDEIGETIYELCEEGLIQVE